MSCNDPNCSCGSVLPEEENKKIETMKITKKKKKSKFVDAIFWLLKYTPAITLAILTYFLLVENLLHMFFSTVSPVFMASLVFLFSWSFHFGLQKLYRFSQEKHSKTFEYALYLLALVSIFVAGYFAVGGFVAHNFHAGINVKIASAFVTLLLGGYFYIIKAEEFLGIPHQTASHSGDCGCG